MESCDEIFALIDDDAFDVGDLADDFLDDGLGNMLAEEIVKGEEATFQTEVPPFAREFRSEHRHKMRSIHRKANLRDVLESLPRPGETYHVLSCNKFDAWTWVPVTVELMGGTTDELYINTWIINHHHVRELAGLLRENRISRTRMMTGLLFKTREPAAYALLVEELARHDGRYLAVPSHAKVTLLANWATDDYIVLEASANMSTNDKVEQTVMTNDRDLYLWYRDWFENVFDRHDQGKALW